MSEGETKIHLSGWANKNDSRLLVMRMTSSAIVPLSRVRVTRKVSSRNKHTQYKSLLRIMQQ
jgi:hypothetical protein